MEAVIKTGGKQYLIKEGDKIQIEKTSHEVGAEIGFDQVLYISDEKNIVVDAKQLKSFKTKLLQSKLDQKFVIEAGSTMYWNKHTNEENIFGIDEFGASAPAKDVFHKFGLTAKRISSTIIKRIKK